MVSWLIILNFVYLSLNIKKIQTEQCFGFQNKTCISTNVLKDTLGLDSAWLPRELAQMSLVFPCRKGLVTKLFFRMDLKTVILSNQVIFLHYSKIQKSYKACTIPFSSR